MLKFTDFGELPKKNSKANWLGWALKKMLLEKFFWQFPKKGKFGRPKRPTLPTLVNCQKKKILESTNFGGSMKNLNLKGALGALICPLSKLPSKPFNSRVQKLVQEPTLIGAKSTELCLVQKEFQGGSKGLNAPPL